MSKSSNTFNDPLIKMEVSKSNFKDWEKKLNTLILFQTIFYHTWIYQLI
jgi:hypothetical protein